MEIDGYKSNLALVSSSVPQGSHLGPLLFLIYFDNISICLSKCKFLLFADDLNIFRDIGSSTHSYEKQNEINISLITVLQTVHILINLNVLL